MVFLDEPTSGLDSAGARKVMTMAKNLSRQGRTIMYVHFAIFWPYLTVLSCTIHQPSSELFKLFDSLLLLQPGGKVVYFGPIGENGDHFRNYCANLGYYMEGK